MARPQKPLEEQLLNAEEELRKTQEREAMLETKITEIKNQIRERDMRNAFEMLEKRGMSVDDLAALLAEKEMDKSDKSEKKIKK